MLTPEQIAALSASTVRLATLVRFEFASGPAHVWNGAGIITVSGIDWDGLGFAGAIDALPQSRGLSADKVTFQLSHVDARVQAIAASSVAEVQGRRVLSWLVCLDEDWRPVGAAIPTWEGTMQRVVVTRTAHGPDGGAGGSRIASVECENRYTARSRPAAGRYTDRDQQTLAPGDNFCRFVSAQRSKSVTWPVFPP